MSQGAVADRQALVRRGLRLEYITLSYNVVEAVVAIAFGAIASSIALIGFGVDAVIESLSGLTMLWRLNQDSHARREHFEQRAQKIIAVSFWALAAYVGYEAAETLLRREAPETSWPGIALAMLSITIMPILARAKRRIGRSINSAAMVADSKQTELCSYLSAILLGGLGLNALFGWWWADPAAGLIMVPIIAREGLSAWRGEGCGCAPGASH
ncbi:MAG: cation transporter [Bryobacteraceae bacterium]|nr:cation transporter [Bryobacteraceae bacterium]